MMPSPRPRSTRKALAGLQFALGTVARPNPAVLIWRWRYELSLAFGVPAGLIELVRTIGLARTIGAITMLIGTVALLPGPRRYLVARAWCVITPHRVRTGCAQAWIHSRRGKIPIVLFVRLKPFGERVHIWCRAGTSAEDFASARHLLIAACWAHGIEIAHSNRFAQLVALDVIRYSQRDLPGDLEPGQGSGVATAPQAAWPSGTDGYRPDADVPTEDGGHAQ